MDKTPQQPPHNDYDPDRDGDWRDYAQCITADPELFFPVGNETREPTKTQVDKAKVICGLCKVSSQCLAYALTTGQDSGIWGGLTEEERRGLKRRNARQKYVASHALENP